MHFVHFMQLMHFATMPESALSAQCDINAQ